MSFYFYRLYNLLFGCVNVFNRSSGVKKILPLRRYSTPDCIVLGP